MVDLVAHPAFCTDGYHFAKIRDELILEPLLVAIVVPDGLPGASDLIVSGREKGLGAKLIALDFSAHTPQIWAHTAYVVAEGRTS
jgi:hypothetical protein